jgi:hypothetical protein
VIIGGQRARSSLVHRALSEHPDTFMPHREIAYFEDPNYGLQSTSDFLAHFAAGRPGAATGFKRPEIMGRPEAPRRLANAMPDARLIVLLREPIARTVSAYFHYVRSAFVPMRPLNEGLRTLLAGTPIPRYPHSHEVLAFSEYGAALDRVLEVFHQEQLLVLVDRDLDADPAGSIRRILGHIGVDPEVPLDLTSRVVNAGDYSSGLQMRGLRAASRVVYRPERRSGLTWARLGWPRVAAYSALTRAAGWLPTPQRPELATLDADVRAALVERLDPDVRRLEAILGRDLSEWPAR